MPHKGKKNKKKQKSHLPSEQTQINNDPISPVDAIPLDSVEENQILTKESEEVQEIRRQLSISYTFIKALLDKYTDHAQETDVYFKKFNDLALDQNMLGIIDLHSNFVPAQKFHLFVSNESLNIALESCEKSFYAFDKFISNTPSTKTVASVETQTDETSANSNNDPSLSDNTDDLISKF